MAHRLREAMQGRPLQDLLSGTVVADETYYGGKLGNMHRQGTKTTYRLKGKNTDNKTPVVALVSAETGEVRARVVPTVNGDTLRRVLTEETEMRSTTLHTDALQSYRPIGKDMAGHEWVDHSSYEYVRDGVSTNLAESYFSQMKRSIDGTFHAVSREHLGRYVDEFSFRWNTRKMTDSERVQKLVDGSVGRRLSYRPLTQH
jgi:transposase-like protein